MKHKKFDSVFFRFGKMDAGCLDTEVFVNGKKRLSACISTCCDPFLELRYWLEDIVKGFSSDYDAHIDCEGSELVLTFESTDEAECGLFHIYDSGTDSVPVKATVGKKDLVTAIYLATLDLAANGYNRPFRNFEKDWYYMENMDNEGDKYDNWSFYNTVKSPLIEWYLYATECYDEHMPTFKKLPEIKETIQMWCDYGGALFWGRGDSPKGACYGDARELYTDTCGTIDLSAIEGLQEWYDEYDRGPIFGEKDYDKERRKQWFERGKEFAMKVRELLPNTIDLFYDDWYPSVEVPQDNAYRFPERLPMIVYNSHSFEKMLLL